MAKQHTHELHLIAGLYSLDAANKKATFYLMNTSRNRNRWGVTDKALDEALPSLVKKPIGMGAGYKIDKHYPDNETMDVGKFVSFENKGNYAFGTADITDEKTLQMLEAGELGPISAVIYPYYDVCSSCGEVLDSTWEQHACIAANKGYALVHSFEFARYDFVDVPAYPQAGFLNFANHKTSIVPLALLAGVYETTSHSPKVKNEVSENKEFETKIAALEQRATQAETALKAAKDEAKANADQVTELSAKLKAIEDEKHAGLVTQAYKTRVEAGIAGEEKADCEMLAALDNKTLALFTVEAEKVAKVVASTQGHQTPKTKYSAAEQGSLESAIKARRASLGLAGLIKEKDKEE